MIHSVPSHSALRVALRRAAHQLYDRPLVFPDPLALSLLLPTYSQQLLRTPNRPSSIALRAFLVLRSRYAEDALHLAVSRGISQYLILGAGLDTFAHRNPYPRLQVFEVDHPSTQLWKQSLLAAASLSLPPNLTCLPADLEHADLPSLLTNAGLDRGAPTFVSCLGVVPYLTLPAFQSILNFLATLPTGSAFTLDYTQPRHALPAHEQLEQDSLSSRLRDRGEPLRLFFTPAEIASQLHAFPTREDPDPSLLNARYFTIHNQLRSDHLYLHSDARRLITVWLP